VRRRVAIVWALLFLNVLSFEKQTLVIPIPHRVGQLITQGALPAALVVALTINRRVVLRLNPFLVLCSVLGILTVMMSIRVAGYGTTYRAFRLVGFLAVLWLITPWWSDRRLVLVRTHLRVLCVILASIALGICLSPRKAFGVNYGSHRLDDALWPIPATQVAHYSAELTGLVIILWMSGIVSRRYALIAAVPAFAAVIASHTRTALVGLIAGLIVGGLSLLIIKRRARMAFLVAVISIIALILPLSPYISSWLLRGQSSSEVTGLSGRTNAWSVVLSEPRPETNKLLGSGLTNGSVIDPSDPAANGLPIDSSWISIYQDQGLVGGVLVASAFLVLIFTALLRPRGPTKALALFLIVYCLLASYTETGMGEASAYLLDLTIAASLLVPRAAIKQRLTGRRWFQRTARIHAERPVAVYRRSARPQFAAPLPGEVLTGLPLAGGLEPPAVPAPAYRELVDAPRVTARDTAKPSLWSAARGAMPRLGWGVADQAMSSVSNFAVGLYIARELGAVQYGAFTLAYVTYAFLLNASRGLATDPLLVRFSDTDGTTWRRAVANATGTAGVVGLIGGAALVAITTVLPGTAKTAFLALGLTLPGLMLQDSWRFSFFAAGKGAKAFVNDTVWVVALIPALLVLKATRHGDVFWFVLVWGLAATVAAAVGPLQAGVRPSLSGTRQWIRQHRDLGPRYLLEGTTNSAAIQLRSYGVGITLGLAAIGYVQAANTLMGPFMVLFFGMALVLTPEAVKVLRRSPRHLPAFCVVVSIGLSLLALLWGLVLIVALPNGFGAFLIPQLWRHVDPLILPLTISIMGGCVTAGAGTGLHALGAANRSLRAMVMASVAYVVFGVGGAITGGAVGTMVGVAIATWLGAAFFWWQLVHELQSSEATRISLPRRTRS
jgi:O-antigen/teichoic acid export membrane protein